jgi:hypothetical protein
MSNSNLLYGQSSRYYNVDNTDDLPQSNMLVNTYNYNTAVVTADEEGRLDLVSYRVYNTPVNWWIIARFNGIINPESVITGTVLKIPVL